MPDISEHKSIIARQKTNEDEVSLEYREYTITDGKYKIHFTQKDLCDKKKFREMFKNNLFEINKKEYNTNGTGIGVAIFEIVPELNQPVKEEQKEKKLGISPLSDRKSGRIRKKKEKDGDVSND